VDSGFGREQVQEEVGGRLDIRTGKGERWRPDDNGIYYKAVLQY
jgi:hypothetical protein